MRCGAGPVRLWFEAGQGREARALRTWGCDARRLDQRGRELDGLESMMRVWVGVELGAS